MEQDKNTNEQFDWDMTTVMLLVLFVVFVLITLIAIGPLGQPIR
jgi:uncharacterized membrane protein (DUF485 family)